MFKPSGNWINAEGVWVSAGTRIWTAITSWPVRGSTALCSMAHSSGASRLALPQRAVQPGGGGGFAVGAPLSVGADAGGLLAGVCADFAGALDLAGCWEWATPITPEATIIAASIASL